MSLRCVLMVVVYGGEWFMWRSWFIIDRVLYWFNFFLLSDWIIVYFSCLGWVVVRWLYIMMYCYFGLVDLRLRWMEYLVVLVWVVVLDCFCFSFCCIWYDGELRYWLIMIVVLGLSEFICWYLFFLDIRF